MVLKKSCSPSAKFKVLLISDICVCLRPPGKSSEQITVYLRLFNPQKREKNYIKEKKEVGVVRTRRAERQSEAGSNYSPSPPLDDSTRYEQEQTQYSRKSTVSGQHFPLPYKLETTFECPQHFLSPISHCFPSQVTTCFVI